MKNLNNRDIFLLGMIAGAALAGILALMARMVMS
jgi:hypothetical protein